MPKFKKIKRLIAVSPTTEAIEARWKNLKQLISIYNLTKGLIWEDYWAKRYFDKWAREAIRNQIKEFKNLSSKQFEIKVLTQRDVEEINKIPGLKVFPGQIGIWYTEIFPNSQVYQGFLGEPLEFLRTVIRQMGAFEIQYPRQEKK